MAYLEIILKGKKRTTSHFKEENTVMPPKTFTSADA